MLQISPIMFSNSSLPSVCKMRRILWPIVFYLPFIPLRYYVLADYLLWPISQLLHQHFWTAIGVACRVNLFDEMSICKLTDSSVNNADHYAVAIQTEFIGLESLMSHATKAMPLVQNLITAHLSVDDLIMVVKMSSLVSRAPLIKELSAISVKTKEASHNLQKLFTQVQDSVDMYIFFLYVTLG